MAKVYKLEKEGDSPDYYFYCPGCDCDHGVWTTLSSGNTSVWQFNGDLNKPSFYPSIRVRHGMDQVCHSFVKNGYIEYLSDCTHKYAGKTMPLQEVDI